MSIFINNALSGLLAAQRGLQTTSNNVANAATEGYVRQRVELVEGKSHFSGGFAVGSGVMVGGIERIYDQFLAEELKNAAMTESRAGTFNDLTLRLDALLGDPDLAIAQSVQRFFDQAEALNRNPTSAVNRAQLIAEAESLTSRFDQLSTQLDRIGNEVDGRLEQSVNQVNVLADSLAQVNEQMNFSRDTTSNDLLDEQDRLLKRLAEEIDFTVIREDDGTVNVLIGNGQPLVLGVDTFDLALIPNEFDGSTMELAVKNGSQLQLISNKVSGGKLAGLLNFRAEVLNGARRELGRLAIGLSELFNQQHRLGVDLNGQLGGDFFAGISVPVSASANNTGTGSVSTAIGDTSAIEARDYLMVFDGAAWQLLDADTGATIPMTGTGSAGDPFVAQGLEITVSAGAAAGDRFLLMPVSQAASAMSVAISDPSKIAAAAPVAASVSLQNLSDASISTPAVTDISDPNLLQSVNIIFDDPATFRIYDSGGTDLTGPLAYTSGADINFNGWVVRIDGSPAAGDRFSVGATGAASGGNGNALALSELITQDYFAGGQLSLSDLGANMLANVGLVAGRASQDFAIQGALRERIELDVESVSGVNLEEEAVNMMRYQEAFMAASRMISVANEMFQSLLNAIGR